MLSAWQLYGMAFLEIVAVGGYLAAALRRSPRGNRWPPWRTASFLGGVAVVALALHSDIAQHDDVFAVHVSQHLLLMMLAAPLLAAGAPVTLALRTLGKRGRRRLVGILKEPAMRPLGGRAAAILVPFDYYASMAIYLLTPLYALSAENEAVHAAAHLYFLTCGLLFWTAILCLDPVRWRPHPSTARLVVAFGLPASIVLGALLVLAHTPVSGVSPAATRSGGWILLFAGCGLTAVGLLLVRAVRPVGSAHGQRGRNHVRPGPIDRAQRGAG